MSASTPGSQLPGAAAGACCASDADSQRAQGHLSAVEEAQELHRILELSQLRRRFQYQKLVQHYVSQIRFGCKNPDCKTPTCFSRNYHDSSRPYRAPSQLTAYALATYLASQDCSISVPCPHELLKPHIETSCGGTDAGLSPHCHDKSHRLVGYPGNAKEGPAIDKATNSSPQVQQTQQSPLDAVNAQRQMRKDTKSLGQNLYDSLGMMSFFLQQIPSPASVFPRLLAPTAMSSPVVWPCRSAADDTQPIEPQTGHERVPHTNGAAVTSQAVATAHAAWDEFPQHLQGNDHSHTQHVFSNLTSNGHQVNNTNDASNTEPESTATTSANLTTPRGTLYHARLFVEKTNKNFPYDGDIELTMGKPKPSPCNLKPPEPLKNLGREVPTLPVFPTLDCDLLDKLKEHMDDHGKCISPEVKFGVESIDSNDTRATTTLFVNRTLFYNLSDFGSLLNCFQDPNKDFENSFLPHLDSAHLARSFRDWKGYNGALIVESLWVAVEAMFSPPPELDAQKSHHFTSAHASARKDRSSEPSNDAANAKPKSRYLNALEAAHISVICIHALTSSVPTGWPQTWEQIRKLRSHGIIAPSTPSNLENSLHSFMIIIDELEDEPALRLMDRLLRAIGARMCFERILFARQHKDVIDRNPTATLSKDSIVDIIIQHLGVVEGLALRSRLELNSDHTVSKDPGWTVTATLLEWLRTIVIKKWDSNPQISKWGSVGVAVQLLDKLYKHRALLNLRSEMFEMPFFNERIDTLDEPAKFLKWKPSTNQLHIFQYPNLFSTHHIVTYFRTMNFTRILSQYDHTIRTQNIHRSLEMFLKGPLSWKVSTHLKTTFLEHLVLRVSRRDVLEDTLNQLWGQEMRLLLKPLKVRLGDGIGGEVGLDHGGVTNEFFSIVLAEAFKPDKGMFAIDSQTHMTWFQPGSLEPPWKFEMIGLLFSLAVYNGVTLPVSFPLILYHLLLPSDSRCRCIERLSQMDFLKDGWPDLARSFEELLCWSQDDVGDAIMRDYTFSYEFLGQKVDHNMKYPFRHYDTQGNVDETSGSVPEPDLVTNANRKDFVDDYIRFLTIDSIEPQLQAFQKGWATCLHPRSMHLFTASSLRSLVEGTQHISIPELQQVAEYDGDYTAVSPTIRAFWAVVEAYDQDDARRLLEFVTACDRIPVTGYEKITFKIFKVGGAPQKLPTSSTCFGTLYLPDYGDVDIVKEKLGLAIENSRGFGII